jgi:hypothetical protein
MPVLFDPAHPFCHGSHRFTSWFPNVHFEFFFPCADFAISEWAPLPTQVAEASVWAHQVQVSKELQFSEHLEEKDTIIQELSNSLSLELQKVLLLQSCIEQSFLTRSIVLSYSCHGVFHSDPSYFL